MACSKVEHQMGKGRAKDGAIGVPGGRLAEWHVLREPNLARIDEVREGGLGAVWQVRLELQAIASSRSGIVVRKKEILTFVGGELDAPFHPIQWTGLEAHEPPFGMLAMIIEPRDKRLLLLLPEMLNHSRDGDTIVSVRRTNARLARRHAEPLEMSLKLRRQRAKELAREGCGIHATICVKPKQS